MRARTLRWLMVFSIAAIAFGALGYSVVLAQEVEKIPDGDLPAGVKNAGEYATPNWTGAGEHPGKKLFDQTCGVCHSLGADTKTGPGFGGTPSLYKRIADSHKGENPYKVIHDYVLRTVQGNDPKNYDKDPYFKEVQEKVAGEGVQMATRGNLPPDVTDRQLYDIIDYIFHFRASTFDEDAYWRQVKLGRQLVSGAVPFEYGGPSCTGCHTAGPDEDLRGAGIGPDIADAYVLARKRGKDAKHNYTDGMWQILSGPDAPAAHFYYKDEEGVTPRRPLTEGELAAVTKFFEQEAREVGTERDSNYLPIFALLAAALGILVLEPTVLNVLFVKSGPEFIDGPYAEEEHHHEEPGPEAGAGPPPEAEEPKAEAAAEAEKPAEKPAEEPKAEEPKAEEEKPAEQGPTEEKSAEVSAEAAEPQAEAAAEGEKPTEPAEEAKEEVKEEVKEEEKPGEPAAEAAAEAEEKTAEEKTAEEPKAEAEDKAEESKADGDGEASDKPDDKKEDDKKEDKKEEQ